jgi:uncharacterized 2Fe-2S/4Fe-4S cluster protein (DUF4445 family)
MKLRVGTDKVFELPKSESVFKTLKKNRIYLTSSCGGRGTCGKCKIRIVGGEYKVLSYGKLDEKERQEGIVLACQTMQRGDLSIDIPPASRLAIGDKIALFRSKDLYEQLKRCNVTINPIVQRLEVKLDPPTLHNNTPDLERLKGFLREKGMNLSFPRDFIVHLADSLRREHWHFDLCYEKKEGKALYIEAFHRESARYGLAIDVGTTTVVVYLVTLNDGTVLDIGSTYNSQRQFGDDVISRIIHATEKGGIEELRQAVIEDINMLIRPFLERQRLRKDDIESIVITGNTTMTHLFWGINPEYIRMDPYIPTVQTFPVWSSKDSGIEIKDLAPVYTVSGVSCFVGSDIVAGVLAAGIHREQGAALFMDVGTNGEIVVGNRDWLICASCSAGPCFEGSVIKHGMMATEGAIESVVIDGDTLVPALGVIGKVTPSGICGSGMIDTVSELFLKGIINRKGAFVKGQKTGRIREGEDGMEYILYHDEMRDVVLTEADIENVIRAKAAIYAGVSFLINEVGLSFDALERVYIAGGFGNFLDIEKAIILGMLPDMPRERFAFLGNTSVAGAYLCLVSDELRREAEDIASKMTYIDLSSSKRFMDEYMAAMFLPHTDISRFPSLKRLTANLKYKIIHE